MKLTHILYSIMLLGFTIGISQGHLALWKDGQLDPLQVYPILATSFPKKDQLLLEKGIRAESAAELTALLEDYLS